ncbi:hypothetical protein KY284_026527 [Solanum tuberosum]|nr:hypothetical protein KY284_026527 [Solanum tuberosum]
METLRYLAQDGHTVICSIHHSRGSVYAKFDDVVLLTGGSLIYAGPANDEVLAYFSKFEDGNGAGQGWGRAGQYLNGAGQGREVRTTLAFWVKEIISHKVIERMEHTYIELALQRLLPNPNI